MTAVISCRPVRLRAAGDGVISCRVTGDGCQLSSGQAESHAAGDGCHQLSSGQAESHAAGDGCHQLSSGQAESRG